MAVMILPFIFLQRFFFAMSWGVSLAAIFGHVFLMFVVTWLTCWILLSSVFMNASLIYSLAWSTIFIRALVVPQNFHCKLGLCFLSLPSPQTFWFFVLVGYRAWVAVVSLHWRPAYWPSAMVSTTERPWTTKESGRNLWRLGRAPGASRICGR